MTLLGLDFDNTLVRYDKLFHQLALEKDLIEKSLPADKTTIRDYLRSQGKDEQFTLLQGEVYGLRILEAEPSEGMFETLRELKQKGIRMKLISHKTKAPYKGPAYNLRDAAIQWLEKQRFFEQNGLNWSINDIYFEETKEEKVKRIQTLQCDFYVDDLEEILELLPKKIRKILYNKKAPKSSQVLHLQEWSKLQELLCL